MTPLAHSLTVRFRPAIPLARRRHYQQLLDAALQAARLGHVDGGGSMVDGTESDIGAEVVDLDAGVDLVRRILRDSDVPSSTFIQLVAHIGHSDEDGKFSWAADPQTIYSVV